MTKKWREKYVEDLGKFTMAEFLLEFEDATCPDDYDGGFTNDGTWKLRNCWLELFKRLEQAGLITESEIQNFKKKCHTSFSKE